MDKTRGLIALAKKRQSTRWPGYTDIGDYHHGAYECLHVSPYTKAAGNVDAKVMVMLQDWTSHDVIIRELDPFVVKNGYTENFPTNKKLKMLLKEHFGLSLSDTYATNLFPFVKPGGISTPINRLDLLRAAKEFVLPQIEIVQPVIVICLGLVTFNALREACGRSRVFPLGTAIDGSPFDYSGSQIWCQAHTGGLGQAGRNRGGNKVTADWQRMAQTISTR